ncbi:helix-turn-helix domain-containing protein [Methylobacterium trifolii]|uniref:Transcriptional activator NphR n=1 Tax=Methylobacterium trifolii TaxID=1003092 RepID=A0ABQ4TUY0_9HYPH|nr:helix-turn-helix domain-containing protein [Methylobacterium trifolii]GJE59035.1 Transcriptional activator NphR [Methylobacterium trifolii]
MTTETEPRDPQQAKLRRHETKPEGISSITLWQVYRSRLAPLYDVSLPEKGAEAGFGVTSLAYQTTRASLMQTTSVAQILRRGPKQIVNGTDQILLYLQVAGSLSADCDGRRIQVEPGDLVLFDYARPLVSRVGAFTNLVLAVDRDTVPAPLLGLGSALHGYVLPGDSGAGRLLGATLTALLAAAEHLSLGEAEAAVESVLHLAAGLVRSARLAEAETPEAVGMIRYTAALAYIDRHHGDLDLGPDEIAEHVGVSRPTLYRAFEHAGGVHAVLLRRRLDHVMRELLTNPVARESPAVLATRFGFGGPTQLSRTFRARFGLPPGKYCALIEKQDAAWHAAQLARIGFGPEPMVASIAAHASALV